MKKLPYIIRPNGGCMAGWICVSGRTPVSPASLISLPLHLRRTLQPSPQRHSQRSIHLFRDGNVASRSHGSRHVNQFGTGQLAPVPPSSSARRGNNHFPSPPQSGFPTDFFSRRRGHPKVRLIQRDSWLQAIIIGRDANKASRSGLAPVRYEWRPTLTGFG